MLLGVLNLLTATNIFAAIILENVDRVLVLSVVFTLLFAAWAFEINKPIEGEIDG
jgi:hypothetical protein